MLKGYISTDFNGFFEEILAEQLNLRWWAFKISGKEFDLAVAIYVNRTSKLSGEGANVTFYSKPSLY